MERWHDVPLDDLRWDDLCTKEATGQCALCDKLAERERFEQRWFKGGWLLEMKNAVAPSLKKGFRWLLGHKLSAFLVIVGLGFLGCLMYTAWREITHTINCNLQRGKLTSYLRIYLGEQHPIEPRFSGELFFDLLIPSTKRET